MALNTTGSIATFLVNSFGGLSAGVSGNMVDIVDQARQHVANYTCDTIDADNIGAKYQPAIIDFAKADLVDMENAGAGGGDALKLVDLTVDGSSEAMTSAQYQKLAEMKLRALGRGVKFARSIS